MTALAIRHLQERDLPALLEIYNHYVRETPITFDIEPRTLEDRRKWLAGFSTSGRYQCLVAVADGATIGWASSVRYRDRAAYDTTVETGIYLAPDRTRQGVGKRLYRAMFDALAKEDIHRLYGGITQPNAASNALHEGLGFERVGYLAEIGRKFGRFWDVAVYLKNFPDHPDPQAAARTAAG
jgi:phosphinothricin acetyltransferase